MLLLAASAHACEASLPFSEPIPWPNEAASDVPVDAVVRLLSSAFFMSDTGSYDGFNVRGPLGGVPGVIKVGDLELVFTPDEPLEPGAEYTISYACDESGCTEHTFVVADGETSPPTDAPTADISIHQARVDLGCSFGDVQTLQGVVSPPTSSLPDLAIVRVFRVIDEDDAMTAPTAILLPSELPAIDHFWGWGGLEREVCVRLAEEDAAGNQSEPSEMTCMTVQDDGCECGTVSPWGSAGLIGVLVVWGRRARITRPPPREPALPPGR